MSWWRRSKAVEAPPASPNRVLVISAGLERYGQREIAIAVRLRPGEAEAAVRAQLESLLATIEQFAARGQLVSAGGITEFGAPGFSPRRPTA